MSGRSMEEGRGRGSRGSVKNPLTTATSTSPTTQTPKRLSTGGGALTTTTTNPMYGGGKGAIEGRLSPSVWDEGVDGRGAGPQQQQQRQQHFMWDMGDDGPSSFPPAPPPPSSSGGDPRRRPPHGVVGMDPLLSPSQARRLREQGQPPVQMVYPLQPSSASQYTLSLPPPMPSSNPPRLSYQERIQQAQQRFPRHASSQPGPNTHGYSLWGGASGAGGPLVDNNFKGGPAGWDAQAKGGDRNDVVMATNPLW